MVKLLQKCKLKFVNGMRDLYVNVLILLVINCCVDVLWEK